MIFLFFRGVSISICRLNLAVCPSNKCKAFPKLFLKCLCDGETYLSTHILFPVTQLPKQVLRFLTEECNTQAYIIAHTQLHIIWWLNVILLWDFLNAPVFSLSNWLTVSLPVNHYISETSSLKYKQKRQWTVKVSQIWLIYHTILK